MSKATRYLVTGAAGFIGSNFVRHLYAIGEPNNVSLFKNIFPIYGGMIEKSIEREDLKEIKVLLKHFFLFCKTMNETNKTNKNYLD